jgi:hypothetical protein
LAYNARRGLKNGAELRGKSSVLGIVVAWAAKPWAATIPLTPRNFSR